MTHLKTLAISFITLAAIALPATAVDHRDNDRKRSHITTHFGIDMNFGNLRISNYTPKYRKNYQRPMRVYVSLEGGRIRGNQHLTRFQDRVRKDFSRDAGRNFQLVHNPRRADIVVRLDRDDWGRAYKRYVKAGKHGRHSNRHEQRTKMIDKVSYVALRKANNLRQRYYRSASYDRHNTYDRGGRDRYYNERNYRPVSDNRHTQYGH